MPTAPPPDLRLSISAPRTTRFLLAMVLVLVVANCAAMVASDAIGKNAEDVRLAQVFYLDGERNLPTAFSTAILLMAALYLAVGACIERDRGRPAVFWWVMSTGFVAMAIDEAWAFHERLTVPVRKMLGEGQLDIYYSAWVVPAFILLLLLAPLLLRFLAGLPGATRLRFTIAGFIFLGGAVGVELVEGWYMKRYGDRTLMHGVIGTVQETMEMVGVVVFIRALILHLGDMVGEVRLRVANDVRGTVAAESESGGS